MHLSLGDTRGRCREKPAVHEEDRRRLRQHVDWTTGILADDVGDRCVAREGVGAAGKCVLDALEQRSEPRAEFEGGAEIDERSEGAPAIIEDDERSLCAVLSHGRTVPFRIPRDGGRVRGLRAPHPAQAASWPRTPRLASCA